MEVLIDAEDNDGVQVTSIGRHHEAVSVDFTAEPCLVSIKGDARGVTADGVVTALVDTDSSSDDGFWFFEVAQPFASRTRLASASCLLLSLAHVSEGIGEDPVAELAHESETMARPTAIVLLSEHADLYLVTTTTPLLSAPDWVSWTDYSIAFDTSLPWKIAGAPELVRGLERLPIDSQDRLATNADIRDALASAHSLRVRGGQPARAQLVLMRSLVAIRQVGTDD